MPAANALSLRDLRTGRPAEPLPDAAAQAAPAPTGMRRRAGELAGLSLDVPRGEAVVLIGAAGAGKTKALRASCGLQDLASGTVFADGQDVTARAPHRRGLALVASGSALLGMGTVAGGTVRSAVRLAARGLDVDPILDATLLADSANAPVADIGDAARRRVALAQAVASAPICLLLDEPTDGLDAAAAGAFFMALRRVRLSGHAMLIATADVRTALAVADRAVSLVEGTSRQSGWIRDMHDEPADAATASLLGDVNRLPGRVVSEEDDLVTVRLTCGPVVEARRMDAAPDTDCVVCVRPGRIALAAVSAEAMGPGALPGRVRQVRFFGDLMWFELEIGTPRARRPALVEVVRPSAVPTKFAVGDMVAIGWQPYHAMAFRLS